MTKKKMPKGLKIWLDALRSGKYKQARGVLARPNGSFCCLGVLKEVSLGGVPEDCKTPYGESDLSSNLDYQKIKSCLFDWDVELDSCVHMNDSSKFSFSRIADELEGMWERHNGK